LKSHQRNKAAATKMSGVSIYPTMMYEAKCLGTRQTDAGDAFGFDFRC